MRLRTQVVAVLAMHAGFVFSQPMNTVPDRSGFDTAVRPQDDLFNAVNGQWVKDTAIPADKSNYGTFIQLRDRSDERVRQVIEEIAANHAAAAGSSEQKIGAYYRSFVDEAAIERAGLAPLAPWLGQI